MGIFLDITYFDRKVNCFKYSYCKMFWNIAYYSRYKLFFITFKILCIDRPILEFVYISFYHMVHNYFCTGVLAPTDPTSPSTQRWNYESFENLPIIIKGSILVTKYHSFDSGSVKHYCSFGVFSSSSSVSDWWSG